MRLKSPRNALPLLVILSVIGCREEEPEAPLVSAPSTVRTAHQEVNSTNKVLILGSSVSGGLDSREAKAVLAVSPTTQIDVVTPEQWKALSAEQFMAYRTLIIGDAGCQSGTAAFQAATDNRNIWGAIVDGDVAILGTDPTHNRTPQLVESAIEFVLNSVQNHTGMYIALGCAYQDAPADTQVTLLEPFGDFTIQGAPGGCADSGHMLQMYNDLLSRYMVDGLLIGDGCAARSVFTRFPERTFSHAALALNSSGEPLPSQKVYSDVLVDPGVATPYGGTPYILVRGAMPQGTGCGYADPFATEECDLGDGINGSPAVEGQLASETCSFSCHLHWCGDGQVDTQFGEECDLGIKNGRSEDAAGTIGSCTSFCKIPNLPPASTVPPTALCKDVSVVAQYTCGESASIDNGSFDSDSDLVGCTQSPAGPYNLGNTTVTLTCTDQANHTSSCTGVVTVADQLLPVVTLAGPASQALECTAGGTYTEPGVTASDLCEGSLPASSITRTGSVNLEVPAIYSLSYVATDSSGNTSAATTRTVTVSDTLPPTLTLNGSPSETLQCGASYTDPGATASDACAGNLTPNITVSSNLDTAHPGSYTVTYRVADPSGNVSTTVRDLTVGPCSTCTEIRLSDYTLFLLGDYNGGHDIEGKVAAGGNITLSDFSMGHTLPDNNLSQALVAGGNLSLNRGGVWGDAWYGGSYSTNTSVVYPRGTARQGTPINFATRFATLRGLSAQLAAMTANGTTRRENWGGVMLSGTSPTVNVFSVQASAFTGAVLFSIQAPAGSLAVINIRGASATFKGFGQQFSGGIDQHGVLFNFVDTTTINAQGYGFFGTILAPYANVNFTDGSWNGGLYALSLTGNAEGHLDPMPDRDICP